RSRLECSSGCHAITRHLSLWSRILSAFARHLLPSHYTIPRLSPLWRRIQGRGACALWLPLISRHHAENCALGPKRRVRAQSLILPPSSGGHPVSSDELVSPVRRV